MSGNLILLLSLLVLIIIEGTLSPRLGFTRENKVLLWYGRRKRKYVVLF